MIAIDEAVLLGWLDQVPDPEIPAISLVDLGIVRAVRIEGGEVTVTITPTYSGCPAMRVIETAVREALEDRGVESVRIVTQLAPAWTTDWMSEAGKAKLRAYGIAPPAQRAIDTSRLHAGLAAAVSRKGGNVPGVACPLCGSHRTELISRFGATPCKALYRCRDCGEPFDHFKCH